MTAKNKVRGNQLEYETVALFQKYGYPVIRAWGSNGKALGKDEQVDVVAGTLSIQCKRRKKLPNYFGVKELLSLDGKYNALVLREERSKPLICMSLDSFIELYYLDWDTTLQDGLEDE